MNILLQIFIAALSLYYLGILYLVTHPKVSDQYRAYFIDNTSDLSPVELLQLRPIKVNTSYSFDSPYIGFAGWSNAETLFRWSAKKTVKIVFILTENELSKNSIGYLAFRLGPLGSQKIEPSINGYKLDAFVLQDEREWIIPIKNSDLIIGQNNLEFFLPNAKNPDNGDPRTLGVYIKSFYIGSSRS